MASDVEASCLSDPNFAVICSFLEKFATSCGITYPNFSKLQEMLENTVEVPQTLIDLHVKLLRKARKSVSGERWEKALIKFCHTYSSQDGWEIERFGYKKARLGVKLRLLKSLLETQFDLNGRFKTEINRLDAEELRLQPIGRDKLGQAYWSQLDEDCNLRVYREDLDEENWEIVARDREGLVQLITQLSSNEPFNSELENLLNEDSNSQDIEKPITDTGQVDDSPRTDEDEGESEVEEEDEDDDEGSGEEDKDVETSKSKTDNQEKSLKFSDMTPPSIETQERAKLTTKDARFKEDQKCQSPIATHDPENNSHVETEKVVKPFKLDLSKHNSMMKKKEAGLNLSNNDSLGMDLSSKKGLEISKNLNQVKSDAIKAVPDHLKSQTVQDDNDTVCDLTTKNTQRMKKNHDITNIPLAPQNLIQNVATDLSIRNLPYVGIMSDEENVKHLKTTKPSGKRDFNHVSPASPPTSKRIRQDEMGSIVGEAIEEPLMLVRGEGSGKNCDTGNPGKSSDGSSEIVDKSETDKNKTLLEEAEHSDRLAGDSSKDNLNATGSSSTVNCSTKSADLNDGFDIHPKESLSGCDVNVYKGKDAIASPQNQSKLDSIEDKSICSESKVVQDKSAKEYVNIKLKRVHSFETSNESSSLSAPKLDDVTLVHGTEMHKPDSIISSVNKSSTTPADVTLETRTVHTNVLVPSSADKSVRSSEAPLPATKRYLHLSTNLSQSKSLSDTVKCGSEISPTKVAEKTPPKLWSIDNICAPEGKSDAAETSDKFQVDSTTEKTPKISLGVQLPPKSVHPLKRSSRWDVGKPSGDDAVPHGDVSSACKSNMPKQVLGPMCEDTDSLKSEMVKDTVPKPIKDLNTGQCTDALNVEKQDQPRVQSGTDSSSKSFEIQEACSKVEEDIGLSTKPSQRFFFGPGCLQFPGIKEGSSVPPVQVDSSKAGLSTESNTAKLNQLTSKVESETRVASMEKGSMSESKSSVAKTIEPHKQSTPASDAMNVLKQNVNAMAEVKNQSTHESRKEDSRDDGACRGKTTKITSSTVDFLETKASLHIKSDTNMSTLSASLKNTVLPPSLCNTELSHRSPGTQICQDPPKKRDFSFESSSKSTVDVLSNSDLNILGNKSAINEAASTCSKGSEHSVLLESKSEAQSTLSKGIVDIKSLPIHTKICMAKEDVTELPKSSKMEPSLTVVSGDLTQRSSKVSDLNILPPTDTTKAAKPISPTIKCTLQSVSPGKALSAQENELAKVNTSSVNQSTKTLPSKSLSEQPSLPLKKSSVTSETKKSDINKGTASLGSKTGGLEPCAAKPSIQAVSSLGYVSASAQGSPLKSTAEMSPMFTEDSLKTKLLSNLPVSSSATPKEVFAEGIAAISIAVPNLIPTVSQVSKVESSSTSPPEKSTHIGHSNLSVGLTSPTESNSQKSFKSSTVVSTSAIAHSDIMLKDSTTSLMSGRKELLHKNVSNTTPSKLELQQKPCTTSNTALPPIKETCKPKPSFDVTLQQTNTPVETKDSSEMALLTKEVTETKPLKDSVGMLVQTKELVVTKSWKDSSGVVLPTRESINLKSVSGTGGILGHSKDPVDTKLSKGFAETALLTKEQTDTKPLKDATSTIPETKVPIGVSSKNTFGSTPQTKDAIGTKPLEDSSIASSLHTKDLIGNKPCDDSSISPSKSSPLTKPTVEFLGSSVQMKDLSTTKSIPDSIATEAVKKDLVVSTPSSDFGRSKELFETKTSNHSGTTIPQSKQPIKTISSANIIDTRPISLSKELIETQPSKDSSTTILPTKESFQTKPSENSSITIKSTKLLSETKPAKGSNTSLAPTKEPFGTNPVKNSSATKAPTKEPLETKAAKDASATLAPTNDSSATVALPKGPLETKPAKSSSVTVEPTKDSSATVTPTKKPLETKPAKDSSATVTPTEKPLETKAAKDASATLAPTKDSSATVTPTKKPLEKKPAKDSSATVTPTKEPSETKPAKDSSATVTPTKEPLETKLAKDSSATVAPTKDSSASVAPTKDPLETKPADSSATVASTKNSSATVAPTKDHLEIKPAKSSSASVAQTKDPLETKPADPSATVACTKNSSATVAPTKDHLETKPAKNSSAAVAPTKDSSASVAPTKDPLETKPADSSATVACTKNSSATIAPSKEPLETKPANDSIATIAPTNEQVGFKPAKDSSSTVAPTKEQVGFKPVKSSSATVAPTTDSGATVAPTKDSGATIAPTIGSLETKPAKDSGATVAPTKDSSAKITPTKDSSVTTAPTKDSSVTVALTKDSNVTVAPTKDSSATIAPIKEMLGTGPAKDSSAKVAPSKELFGVSPTKNSSATPTKDSSAKVAPSKESFGVSLTKNSSATIAPTKDSSATKPPIREPFGTKLTKDSGATIPPTKNTIVAKESSSTIPRTQMPVKESIEAKPAVDSSGIMPIKSNPSISSGIRQLSKESVGEKPVNEPIVLSQPHKGVVPIDRTTVPNTDAKAHSKDINKTVNDNNAEICSKKTTDTNFPAKYTRENIKSFNETSSSLNKDELKKGLLTETVVDTLPKDIVETNSLAMLTEPNSTKKVLSVSNTQPQELGVSKSIPEHLITQDPIKSTQEYKVTKLSRFIPTVLDPNSDAPLTDKTTALKSVAKELPANSVPPIKTAKGYLEDNKLNPPGMVGLLNLSDTKTASLSGESTGNKGLASTSLVHLKSSEPTEHIPSQESLPTKLASTDEISTSKDSITLKSPSKGVVPPGKKSAIQVNAATLSKLPPAKSIEEQLLVGSSLDSKSTQNQSVVKPTEQLVGELSPKTVAHESIKLKPIEELLVAKTSLTESTITTPTEKSIDSLTKDSTVKSCALTKALEGKSHSTEKSSNVEGSFVKESSAQIPIISKPTTIESTVAKSAAKASIHISSPEQVVSADKSIESHAVAGSTSPIKGQSDHPTLDETSQPTKKAIDKPTVARSTSSKPSSKNSAGAEPCLKESDDGTEPSDGTSKSGSDPSKTLPASDLSLAVGTRKLKPTIAVRSDLSIKKSKMDDEVIMGVQSPNTRATTDEKMDESTESLVETVQTRQQGKLKKPLGTEAEVKPVEVSKVEDKVKPTILGLSLDYNPIENIPKVTTRTREHGPKLKVKKIETLMEVNTNSLEEDDKCQPTETDPLADYDDLIPVTMTRGKKNASLPPPPPVGKRKRRSAENEADDSGKRARQRGKEVISEDEVVEEQLLTKRKGRGRPPKAATNKLPASPKLTRGRSKRVSSTDSTDKDVQPPKKEESKPSKGPRGRRKQVLVARDSSSDGDDIGIDLVRAASSEDSMPIGAKKQSPAKLKQTPRKTRRVLGLEVPVEPEESSTSSGPPMRQSRRIAQIKIKEEAERVQLEEMTLTVMKHEQREKHAQKTDKRSTGEKKKKQKSISDDYSAEGEEPDEDFGSAKKQRKKRKKREKKWTQKDFNESKPWQSSSGSSTSQEEEEEEPAEHSEDDERQITTVLKSDHEFSPESDLEDEAVDARPTRLARTAQKVDTGEEDVVDDAACQKCKASDHPEWILLCDKCDTGWHASCLRPALFVIPEGDWYCPPCQHTSLVVRLHEQLREVDRTAKRRDNEELRKKRLAYVGISLDNVLTKDIKEEVVGNQEESGHESGRGEGSSESSGSGSSSGEESEPIYQLRERRAAVFSYRYNEYDDLINSAIQDELEAVNGAGNQGRGKDIATIVNAEKEESDIQKTEAIEEGKEKDVEKDEDAESDVEEEEEEDGYIPPVKKLVIKKKHRKLNSLDISSEDDPESDEDFKGSSSEGEEEDYEEDADSDDSEMKGRRGRGSSGPVRRSARARTTRFDREFLDDNSDGSDTPRSRGKKKKVRRAWDDTSESEESDSTWGQAPKRPKQASRTYAPKSSESKKKKGKKKKKRVAEGSDIETYKASKPKKPRVKFGGLDESEDVYTARRTRGCKINYVEMGGTDSEEEKFFKSSKPKKLESDEEDEYVANEEEEEEMMDLEEEEKETENESAEDEQIPEQESVPEPEPTPEPELESEEAPSSEPVPIEVDTKGGKQGKAAKGKGKTGIKKSKKVKKVEPLIIPTAAITEDSEEELGDLSLVEDQQLQESVINEAELVKEHKRLKKEVKKLEKKEQKKRGKRKKSELEPGEVLPGTILPCEVIPPSEDLPSEALGPVLPTSMLDSPTKRKGRGRGKAALAKAAATSDVPQGFPTTSSPTQGNSVISRMLQSQPVTPARSFADAASVMGQKYFGDQLLPPGVRGMPTSPRPPFLPVRGRHPSPYRQPGSPGVPPYPGPRSGRPMYHTSHHPLDPSPSGGGPIAIAAEGTPPKHSHGTPPPPYGRGGPPPMMGRFGPPDIGQAPNGGSPLRHPFPSATQSSGSPGRSPNFASYHPPPNYHYGAYPMGTEDALPPAAYQGSSYPETYTSSPLHTSESSNSKPMEEEGSGEFGGLVSYFSSQREDDLDA